MSTTVHKGIPRRFMAGETVKWEETASGFNAADDWQMQIILTTFDDGSGKENYFTVKSAPAEGETYSFHLGSDVTANFQSKADGREWTYFAVVDDERRTPMVVQRQVIRQTTVQVFPDVIAKTGGTDFRSTNEKILCALEAKMLGNANRIELSYTVDGVSVERMSDEQLTAAIATYKWRVYEEKQRGKRAGAPIFMTSSGRR